MPHTGRVLWHTTASLDGYIAGPGDNQDWVFDYVDPTDPDDADVPARTGAVVAGRRSFEVGSRDAREVFDGAWSGPQFLLTHRPVDGLPDGIAVRSGDVRAVIAEALRAAGGKDVLLIGADVARQCLAADLVDEIHVNVAPVLLGDGVRLRSAPGRRDLVLDDISRRGDVVSLRYRLDRRDPS